MTRAFLEKTFDIREGELFRAWSMQLNIFLIITTLLIVKPTVNSLFLSTYGIESLPNAYIFVAIVAGLVTTIYAKMVRHIRFVYLNIGTLLSSVLLLLFFGFALRTGLWDRGIMYAFYIWVSIFAVLTTSQFWLLVNQVFNVREIKRLVGFIGSGAIAGGILGGYLTSFLITHMSSKNLPFVAAFTIFLCIPLTMLIFHRQKKTVKKVLTKNETKKAKEHPFRLILQSRHLTLLACLVAIGNVVAKLVDYQFSDMASSTITDPEKLTAFFGFWFSTFNVAAFVIQLLVTRIILNRFGVGISLLFLPVAIAAAVVCLIIAPELLAAVIVMKMADGALKQSVNKSAMELLVLPIPRDVKNQTKTFIDVFVDSLAAGFSGLLLIFVVKGLSLSTVSISVLILGFVAVWIFLVTKVRKEYLYSFKMKIIKTIDGKQQGRPSLKRKVLIGEVTNILTAGSPAQILEALQQIKLWKDRRYQEHVYQLLAHPNADVRTEAISYLSHYKDKKAYQLIDLMTDDPVTKVQMAAFAYLIEHTHFKNKAVIDKHLDSSSSKLRGLALVSLADEIQNNPKLKRKYNLKERIEKKINNLAKISDPKLSYLEKIYCIQAIGHANIPELFPLLQDFMQDEKPIVVRQALLAAGRSHSGFFINDLVYFSTEKKYSRMANKALRLYRKDLIPHLRQLLKISPDDLKLLRRFPHLVKDLGTQRSVVFVFKLLEHDDSKVRQRALEALSYIHRTFPKLKFRKRKVTIKIYDEMLRLQNSLAVLHGQIEQSKREVSSRSQIRNRIVELLHKQLQTQTDNILFLLSLRYSPENISVIKKGFKSKKTQMRITALEFLDNLVDNRLKKNLIPLFEVAIVDVKNRKNIDMLKLTIPDDIGCFSAILKGRENIRLKINTLHLIRELNDAYYLPLVEDSVHSDDPELKLIAMNILKGMKELRVVRRS